MDDEQLRVRDHEAEMLRHEQRDHDREYMEDDQPMNTSNQPATHASVRAYLEKHYGKTATEITDAMTRSASEVDMAIRLRSNAYYPGDVIASAEGWTELEGVDEPEDEDDDN